MGEQEWVSHGATTEQMGASAVNTFLWLSARYLGLADGYAYTLEEVGKIFSVTRERVRQIEAKAVRKLQHPVRCRKLSAFLDRPLAAVVESPVVNGASPESV